MGFGALWESRMTHEFWPQTRTYYWDGGIIGSTFNGYHRAGQQKDFCGRSSKSREAEFLSFRERERSKKIMVVGLVLFLPILCVYGQDATHTHFCTQHNNREHIALRSKAGYICHNFHLTCPNQYIPGHKNSVIHVLLLVRKILLCRTVLP